MADLQYRFTLNHSYGSQIISEPDGWKDIKIVLERSPEYFSVIELFEVPLIFYGNNGTHDGGKDYILAIESNYGINENIQILIEVSEDELEWDELWSGRLNMETINEIDDRKVQISLLKDDLWARFKNREDTPVDLLSETDLSGNTVDVISPYDVVLPAQTIRYYGEYRWQFGTKYPDDGVNGSLTLDWDQIIKDDLKKFTVPRSKNLLYTAGGDTYTYSAPQFEAPWDGDYEFDIRIEAAEISSDRSTWLSGSMNPRIQVAGGSILPVNFTDTLMPGNYRVYTFQGTFPLKKGDQVVIFGTSGSDIEVFGETRLIYKTEVRLATTGNITLSGEQVIDGEMTSSDRVLVWKQGNPAENGIYVSGAGAWTRATDNDSAAEMINAAVYITDGDANTKAAFRQTATVTTLGTSAVTWEFFIHSFERHLPYPGVGPVQNYVIVTAMTTYPETTSEGLLIHDVISEVIKRSAQAPVVSELFGGINTRSRLYEQDGCEWNHILLKGLHLRGYTMAQKSFFLSFKDWWNIVNPIFNIGLSYEMHEGEQVIRIEDKAYFFDADPIIQLNWVNNIFRNYDKDHIIKSISIGYEKWQAEDISGLDDPQSKKVYSTILETIGTDKTLYSKGIAASLAIEVTRRKTIDQSSDYKFDNDTFIISVKPDILDSPVNAFTPELDENFTSVTGLLDPETRYNQMLTPARNFLRWANYFNGCLQKYLYCYYKFVSGEGNYAMSSQYDCGSGPKADCQGTVCFDLAENADLLISDFDASVGHLFTPETLEFEHPLSWSDYKLIRDNRTRAIAVSKTDSGHMICFIKRIEYDLNKSKAKFTLWKR